MKRGIIGKKNKEITVIGAGFAGLTAACILEREGHRVIVRDASDGIGGSQGLHPSSLLAMRVKCALNGDFASKPHEPLRWFR